MIPERVPIAGREDKARLTTPLQVLSEFYAAFNSRNLEKMSQNWAQSDEIALDNPVGGVKRGWSEIKAVYERIFNGPAQVYGSITV